MDTKLQLTKTLKQLTHFIALFISYYYDINNRYSFVCLIDKINNTFIITY